jgi:hypothetical protein
LALDFLDIEINVPTPLDDPHQMRLTIAKGPDQRRPGGLELLIERSRSGQ